MVYSVLSIRHTLFSPYVLLCSLHIVYSVLSIWFTLFYYKRSWCHSFEIPLDYRCIDFWWNCLIKIFVSKWTVKILGVLGEGSSMRRKRVQEILRLLWKISWVAKSIKSWQKNQHHFISNHCDYYQTWFNNNNRI